MTERAGEVHIFAVASHDESVVQGGHCERRVLVERSGKEPARPDNIVLVVGAQPVFVEPVRDDGAGGAFSPRHGRGNLEITRDLLGEKIGELRQIRTFRYIRAARFPRREIDSPEIGAQRSVRSA